MQEQVQLLLDTHLGNLSQRLFEIGKKADQQITAWLAFAALTVLLSVGVTDAISIGGLTLKAEIAAAVTFGLACAFYYRAVLSMAALGIWREAVWERRGLRFATFLEVARQLGSESEQAAQRDIRGFVPEYPGYLACSVLIKAAAQEQKDLSGKYIVSVHNLIVAVFASSPYLIGGCLIYSTWLSWWMVGVVGLGLAVTLSANVIIRRDRPAARPALRAPDAGR